jgi:hypothetical protein
VLPSKYLDFSKNWIKQNEKDVNDELAPFSVGEGRGDEGQRKNEIPKTSNYNQ